MAVLTTQQRKNLPTKDYALPAQKGNANNGKYPMPDAEHARVAKAFAARFASPSQKKVIDAKANAKIKAAGGKPTMDKEDLKDGGKDEATEKH